MDWFDALILGLVQGLTEFLPVSSSGHISIVSELLEVNVDNNLIFTVALHAATVCSTILALRKELFALLSGLFKFKWNEETIYVAKIIISMIPVGIVGVFFKKYIEAIFGSGLFVVGCCLIVTAIVLSVAYYAKPKPKQTISFRDAFVIGLAQAVAVLPGLSRSGSTIATGLLLGNNKESVAKFSFLMVLVPILGEAFLDVVGGEFSSENGLGILPLLVGVLAAFISGYVACRWMINIVKRGKLIWFALYCVVVGVILIIKYV